MRSEAEMEQKKRLVNKVIGRMIKHDGIIIVVNEFNEDGSKVPQEQRILKVHPSYQM